ncbi:hypothetical protein M501DRAFT_1002628 [Patellaria atrata CBS 101060]|uniref:Uncharacterized protein n=1 Tax=Patellaria atrata CBS 101060 TaxID=1346257 RepID=A0A9P4SCY8_9PEZI|nr:hypothetical protein M501DRAFT_1002628 [Patellaria atrata CBS 101060]
MDRDRDRDRDRRPYDRDRYGSGAGESYRPARSPPRRPPPPAGDTYVPDSRRAPRTRSRSPEYRRRSRSPPRNLYRDTGTYRARERSPPPRREFSPRREDYRGTYRNEYREGRGRSPIRETRYARSPVRTRERSPVAPPLKRSRDVSPVGSRGMRSPAPSKRERHVSPRRARYVDDTYGSRPASRAHSPRRPGYTPSYDGRRSPPLETAPAFRPRSRSPRRVERVDPYTVDNWRRRSPSPRAGYPVDTARSPYPANPTERSPIPKRDSPPPRERSYNAPPSGPSYRNGDSSYARPPPSGPPTGPRNFPAAAISPPAGPSSSSISISAHNRAPNNPLLSAPSRPRGGGGRGGYGRDPSYDYPPRDYPTRRGSAHWTGRGSGPPPSYAHSGPPAGPRGPPFRGSHNSTSTTYPRTQRFRDHLSDLPSIVPGGQLLPEYEPAKAAKIEKLEEEARKLREAIKAKEDAKRKGEREWANLEREAENAGLRSELAEASLRALNGEDMSGSAF